jgi:hypothetical protein
MCTNIAQAFVFSACLPVAKVEDPEIVDRLSEMDAAVVDRAVYEDLLESAGALPSISSIGSVEELLSRRYELAQPGLDAAQQWHRHWVQLTSNPGASKNAGTGAALQWRYGGRANFGSLGGCRTFPRGWKGIGNM